jgi:hypothetical protein
VASLHLGGVGVSVSLRHNSLSFVRIRGSSHPCGNIVNVGKLSKIKRDTNAQTWEGRSVGVGMGTCVGRSAGIGAGTCVGQCVGV